MASKKNQKTALIVLGVIHLIGAIGLQIDPVRSLLIKTTPLILTLDFILAVAFHPQKSIKLYIMLLCIAITGFAIEYAGVKTGWIFGNYAYGSTLGPSFRAVPYIIGLNWAALVFYSAQFVATFKNVWLKSAVGASLMLIFDFALEPIAIKYDFWTWDQGTIPIQNYFAWWLISFCFHLTFNGSKINAKGEAGKWMYLIQLGFFIALLLAIHFI